MSPPKEAGGHQAPQPDSRPNAVALAKGPGTAMVNDGGPGARDSAGAAVLIDLTVLLAAADLIGSQAGREHEVYRLGQLAGFADGWARGLAAGYERACAA